MRMKAKGRAGVSGFTLIEIMVVITIIAALIGAGSLMINIAMKNKAKTKTQNVLIAIGGALEQLRSTDQLGRYPPTSIAKLSFSGFDGNKFGGQPNARNVGIETIYVVFRLPGISIMPAGVESESAVVNTDGKPGTSGQLLGALCGGEGVGDLVERLAAGEHLVERVQRDADAVVGHAVLLEVVRADLLRPAATLHLITPRIGLLRVLAISFDLQEP